MDPRTPVIVGAGVADQQGLEPGRGLEAADLMVEALERAAEGTTSLLSGLDVVLVPEGTWHYRDPGRLVAERIGSPHARTLLATIGVLQLSLLSRAAALVAAGDAEVVAVVGGEAKERHRQAVRAGIEAPETSQPDGVRPDETWAPHADILPAVEIERDLAVPAQQYAVMESALAADAAGGAAAHLRRMAALWSGFSEVAAANPHAWSRDVVPPDSLLGGDPANPMVSSPYTRRHCSQWNVDQAGAVLVCSAAAAEAHGVAADRWVFPVAAAASNAMVPLSERAEPARSPGFAEAGRAVAAHAGVDLGAVDLVELYSCFPAAVQIQVRELGLPPDRPLTLTGGMAFAGGPLNNFCLQAATPMVGALRARPGALGLMTAVSGMITKQGVTLLSSAPPARPFRAADVAEAALAATRRVEVVPDLVGPATIVGATVIHHGGSPARAVALADDAGSRRAVVRSDEPDIVASMATESWVGREIRCAGEWFAID